jgi:hypothetical protein
MSNATTPTITGRGTRGRRLALSLGVIGTAVTVAASCTPDGGAVTWYDPPNRPMVVEDHTGWSVPVRAAVGNWGTGLIYGRCVPQFSCVRVYEAYLQFPVISGQARTVFSTGNSTVYIDPHMRREGYFTRLQLICHELGHAQGLNHDNYGCLRPWADGRNPYPTGSERRLADRLR